MTNITNSEDTIELAISHDELSMLIGSILGARQFMDDNEFSTVVGFEKEELTPLYRRLVGLRSEPAERETD